MFSSISAPRGYFISTPFSFLTQCLMKREQQILLFFYSKEKKQQKEKSKLKSSITFIITVQSTSAML